MPPPASPVQRQNRDVRVSLLGPKAVLSCSESGNPTLLLWQQTLTTARKQGCAEGIPKWALPVSSYRDAQFAITTTQPGELSAAVALTSRETPSGRGQGNPAWGEKPHLCPHSLPGLGCDTKHRSLTPVQGVTSFRGFEPIIHNLRAILNDL